MRSIYLTIFILFYFNTTEATIRVGPFEFLTSDEYHFFERQLESKTSLCTQNIELDLHQTSLSLETTKIDSILVSKKQRRLVLISKGVVFAAYRIALGKNPIGDKYEEGDSKTPEGLYFIDFKNSYSDYHLSLKINYPNTQDIEESRRLGISDPGGDIMIHGLPNNPIKRKLIRHPSDWTRGCMAVTNNEIEQIFQTVELGTPIEICP